MDNWGEATGYCPKQDQEYTIEVDRTMVRALGYNEPDFDVTMHSCAYGQANGCEHLKAKTKAKECPIVIEERKDMKQIIEAMMLEQTFFHT